MSTTISTSTDNLAERGAVDTQDRAPDVSASLAGVGKTFTAKGRRVDALQDINLDIREGEYVVILGPSGCGKSTLLRCVAGLETPTSGRINLSGKAVFDADRGIDTKVNDRNLGMVFQNYALWPHMNVAKNVAYPLRMRKVPKSDRASRVEAVLAALECGPLADRLPAELSGGQQQRIALARALVYEPGLLLLDEPLSNLDALLRVSLRSELLRLHRSLGFTGLHITHDQEEALEMGDRVVLMREGRIEQMGSPADVYARPVSPYAANFLGVRNRVAVTVENGQLAHDGGRLAGSETIVSALTGDATDLELFVRSRDTHVARGESTGAPAGDVHVDGVVAQVVLGDGGRRQYVVDIGGRTWFTQHADADDLQPGEAVHVAVPTRQVLVYQGNELVSKLDTTSPQEGKSP